MGLWRNRPATAVYWGSSQSSRRVSRKGLIAPAGSRESPVPYCHDCICGFASLLSTSPTQPLAVPYTHTISNAHLQPRWRCILHISNYTHRQVAPAEHESFHCASFSNHGISLAVAFTSQPPLQAKPLFLFFSCPSRLSIKIQEIPRHPADLRQNLLAPLSNFTTREHQS